MIEYTHIKNLLQDNQYFADLLNGPCKPISLDNGGDKGNYGPDGKYIPINPGWIDEERSSRMTDIYHNLIPIEMPYMTMVRVVRNPDVQMDWCQLFAQLLLRKSHLRTKVRIFLKS